MTKKSFIYISFLAIIPGGVFSQTIRGSLATDLGLQYSFKKEQQYWAVGHTVHGVFNISSRDGAYAWISYYSEGKFKNNVTAIAKSSSTNPQQINYINSAKMRFKQFSMGWKHYFRGGCDIEEGWSLYGYSGFGLLLCRIENTHSATVDTSRYADPVLTGKANFKRLTLDLGLGWEVPLGGAIYFYNEVRLWIPTTHYASRYLFVNRDAPLVAMLNFGLRVFFD